jgi:hypothetical protein
MNENKIKYDAKMRTEKLDIIRESTRRKVRVK